LTLPTIGVHFNNAPCGLSLSRWENEHVFFDLFFPPPEFFVVFIDRCGKRKSEKKNNDYPQSPLSHGTASYVSNSIQMNETELKLKEIFNECSMKKQ